MAGEKNKSHNNISFDEILKNLDIDILSSKDFIKLITADKKTYSLSLFPAVIQDYKKYNQVEIFYQRYLDNKITKKEFETNEQKIHQALKTLWCYNDVYAVVNDGLKQIKKSYYYKKNKKLISKKHLQGFFESDSTFFLVDKKK